MQSVAFLNRTMVGNELADVQGKLEAVRRQEFHFTKLLTQVESLKRSAIHEREVLEGRERELMTLLAPISRLPNEILGEIFTFLAKAEMSNWATPGVTATPSSITVSHVSQRWRAVALSNPHVWSYIHLRYRWRTKEAQAILSRSRNISLAISYSSSRLMCRDAEVEDAKTILGLLTDKWHRIRRLEVNTVTSSAMVPFVRALNDTSRSFDCLSFLSLNITTFNPQHTISTDGLLPNNGPDQANIPPKLNIPSWSSLSHLKLQEIPLFNLPHHFIANLVSLELQYPPRKSQIAIGQDRYWLTASALLHFLSLTPHLEELTLSNTYPIFDGVRFAVPGVDPSTFLGVTRLIKLSRLRTIKWSFPSVSSLDAHRLMGLLDIPALEKLDLWVEVNAKAAVDLFHPHGWPTPVAVIEYPQVRELWFQFARDGDENPLNSLRKFTFPTLQYLDLGGITDDSGKGDKKLSLMPRLETLFRDPRQPCLTRLALSNFELNTEHSRSLLGYIPALVSLSLEFCAGAAHLIKILAETCSIDRNVATPAIRGAKRGVRFCPRLEALSFWGCNDLTIGPVLQVTLARNSGVGGVPVSPRSTLSTGCCERLVTAPEGDSVYNTHHIVQVISVRRDDPKCGCLPSPPPELYSFVFSDGTHYTQGVLPTSVNELVRNGSIRPNSLVAIEKSTYVDGGHKCIPKYVPIFYSFAAGLRWYETRVVFVESLSLLGHFSMALGSPTQIGACTGSISGVAPSEATAVRGQDVQGPKPTLEPSDIKTDPHAAVTAGAGGRASVGIEGAVEAGVSGGMGRKIASSRKSLAAVPLSVPNGPRQTSSGGPFAGRNPWEVTPPCPIVYTRIDRCPLINSEHADQLGNLVGDVIWIGEE